MRSRRSAIGASAKAAESSTKDTRAPSIGSPSAPTTRAAIFTRPESRSAGSDACRCERGAALGASTRQKSRCASTSRSLLDGEELTPPGETDLAPRVDRSDQRQRRRMRARGDQALQAGVHAGAEACERPCAEQREVAGLAEDGLVDGLEA